MPICTNFISHPPQTVASPSTNSATWEGVFILAVALNRCVLQVFHQADFVGGTYAMSTKIPVALVGFDCQATPVEIEIGTSVLDIDELVPSWEMLVDPSLQEEDEFKNLTESEAFVMRNLITIPNVQTLFFPFLPFLPGYSVFVIPFSVYGIPFSVYVNNFHIFYLCDCMFCLCDHIFCFMLIIFRLRSFNVTYQEVFSTLSTASTSGSVRLRMENF